MDKTYDEFDVFVWEAGQPEEEAATLEDLKKRFPMPRNPWAEGFAKPSDVSDATDVDALIAQQCGTSHVSESGHVVTPPGESVNEATTQLPLDDPLMLALDVEGNHDATNDPSRSGYHDLRWGPSPVKLESAHDLGREPLPPGPGLLRRSTAEILDLVAQHAPAGARELAKTLAARARELEVT